MHMQIEREALAIVFAVKKFYQYLCGSPFTLVMDHRPLCKILGHNQGVPTLAAARMQQWALILSAYSYRIEYKPGSQKLPAASTARDSAEKTSMIQEMDVSTLPVSAENIARATKQDSTLAAALQQVRLGHWPVQPSDDLVPFYRRQMELSCRDGCLLWGQRVIIPKRLRNQLLAELHEGHVGVCRMKALARSFVWWPGLDQDLEVVAAKCDKCKLTASMPATVPQHPWQHSSSPWDRIHIDFGEWNQKHFLVVVVVNGLRLDICHRQQQLSAL